MTVGVGTVYLVGAGPGDPDLITLRGLNLLRSADVVIHDRLIAPELLDEIRPDAEVVDVGKHPGFQRYTQEEINNLIMDRAQRGDEVVRLKGGDPFVFGRGSEEALACMRARVPFVVVPGVSSVNAVPAAAGIPLTHRGVSRTYAVITGQVDGNIREPNIPYGALSKIDTIVILMGRLNLADITSGLIEAGRSPDTPATCVETGCTPEQRVVNGTLATISGRVDQAGLRAPVVTVVGEVASFASVTDTRVKEFAVLGQRLVS